MATKQQAAATPDKPLALAEQALQHSVYFSASTCDIKDDVVQLAAVWRSGHGPVSKQEAGLLLWYHCHRGEDGQTEVAGAGAINSCLATLNSQDATTADKSIAAGILLTLCHDARHKEAVVKAKAGPDSCCQVLHACLACQESMPRHVVALLASLASNPTCLAVLLKALQGEVPWAVYCQLLAGSTKDHATAISTADLVRCIITGREALAVEAAAAGLLQALLRCAASHKSAAAVAAAAACLQALCEAAPGHRAKLGELPGAVRVLVDLLGAPPATVVAWEQQEYKHILQPPPPPAAAAAAAAAQAQAPHVTIALPGSGQQGSMEQQQQQQQQQQDPNCQRAVISSSIAGSARTLGLANPASSILRGSMTPRRIGTGALEDAGALGQSKTGRSMMISKSNRLPDIGEGESAAVAAAEGRPADKALYSKSSMARRGGSVTGSDGSGSIAAGRTRKGLNHLNTTCPAGETPKLPQPTQPLLYKNSTALKWQGPVPDATRCAVAGVLAELVQLPQLCRAVHDRLGASRLAALLQATMAALLDGGGGKGGKSKKKKKGGSLALTPENQAYLCNVCVCLKFLTAAGNADCYRVAAAGCLPALVQLAAGSKVTRLRQSAKAVLSQAALLAEVAELVQQTEVPEELLVQVPMKLVDEEVRQLLWEFPDHTQRLQRLHDVSARARK